MDRELQYPSQTPEIADRQQQIGHRIGQVLSSLDLIYEAELYKNTPMDELRYPGLLDISVTPNWRKIISWAHGRFGTENVRYQSVLDLIADMPQMKSVDQITGRRIPVDANIKAVFERYFKELIESYDFLLIKK